MATVKVTEATEFEYIRVPYCGMEDLNACRRWQVLCRFIPQGTAEEMAGMALYLARECGLSPEYIVAYDFGVAKAGGPSAGAYVVQFNMWPRLPNVPAHESTARVELGRWGGARG